MSPPYNVLFLCTGNSSRSILAEAILRHRGEPNFWAFSAGSHPAGYLNPYALRQLEAAGLSINGLRSKSWDEFAKPGAAVMNFVFSAGSHPAGYLNPYALRQLEAAGLSINGLRSKSWDEFAKPGAAVMNFVF